MLPIGSSAHSDPPAIPIDSLRKRVLPKEFPKRHPFPTISLALLSIALSACGGDDAGDDKALSGACTVAELDDGTAAIRCPDGSEFIVKNGAGGAKGDTGAKGADGSDGANGATGPKGDPGDDGQDGQPCVVSESPDGIHTLTCGSNSVVIGGACEEGLEFDLDASDPLVSMILQVSNCTWIRGDVNFNSYGEDALPSAWARILRIDGDLVFMNTASLTNIDVSRLQDIGGDLLIGDVPVLRHLDFSALEEVGGELKIEAASSLEGIDFPSLREVGSDLRVNSNTALHHAGFPALESVGGWLSIGGNQKFDDLDPLTSLKFFGVFEFQNNNSHEALPAFPALAEVGLGEGVAASYSIVFIHKNQKLKTMGALGSLTDIDGHVTIAENPLLSHDETEALFKTITITGSVTMCGNQDGPTC